MIVIHHLLLVCSKFSYFLLITRSLSFFVHLLPTLAFAMYLGGQLCPCLPVLLAAIWWRSQYQNCELTSRISGSTHLGNQKLWLRAAEGTSANSGAVLLLMLHLKRRSWAVASCELFTSRTNLAIIKCDIHWTNSIIQNNLKTIKAAKRNPSCSAP